jgi:hypothetical protein
MIIGLRAVWVILMLIFLLLIVNNAIAGWGTVLYSLAVMAVMFTEMYLRPRGGRRAAR